MNAANYLASGLRGIVAAAFLSCAGPTLATRPYTAENRQENAYLNMRDMLAEVCCNSAFDSYPRCKYFKISPSQGFHCVQQVATPGNYVISHFSWDEIEKVECLGKTIKITGEYDSSSIYTGGRTWQDINPQCTDLEKAMKIYLEERKK